MPDEQINVCQRAGTPLAKFLRIPQNLNDVESSYYEFSSTPELTAKDPKLFEGGRVVLTLGKGVAAKDDLDRARFSLSINSCVGCHGMEPRSPRLPAGTVADRTLFDHIRYP